MADDPIYTLQEIAEALGKHPSTIRYRVNRGQLEAEKVGNKWLVRPSVLRRLRDELANSGELQPNQPDWSDGTPAAALNLADQLSPLP